MSVRLSRRDILKICVAGAIASGATVLTAAIVARPPDMKLPNPYPEMPDKPPEMPKQGAVHFLNEHQYALVATLAAILIPTDEEPGAAEAGVAEYIDKLAAQSEKRKKAYTEGLAWIDTVSDRRHSKEFLKLTIHEQIGLLRFIDNAAAMRNQKVSNFFGRVDRKIDTLWDDLFGAGAGLGFMKRLREDVFFGYYSNPISWKVVGFYGPPQPVGYPNYVKPPSSAMYTGFRRSVDDKTCVSCHFEQTKLPSHINRDSCTQCHPSHIDAGGKK